MEADDDVGEQLPAAKIRLCKNPDVETSFLPDKERDAERARLEAERKQQLDQEEEKLKAQIITITYSYWDGSGHRRSIKVSQGTSVGAFIDLARKALIKTFPYLRRCSAENLIYVKEDLIIPHNMTFYEFTSKKLRGKSGPLFHFNVHDDVRLVNDVRREKLESHAGKITMRSWYEKNKHIFPASRWEVFDPTKDYGAYTIGGGDGASAKKTKKTWRDFVSRKTR